MSIPIQQHNHIMITSNILGMMSPGVNISFLKSILIVVLIAKIYVKYTHSISLLKWQEIIIFIVINFYGYRSYICYEFL